MNEIVFFLEEPSAAEMLRGLLPKFLPNQIGWRTVVFEGKHDLEKQLVKKLRGYRNPGAGFIIMRDKDAEDCHGIKARLKIRCQEAGKPGALVRIACHELESFYLADLKAVEVGLSVSGLTQKQNNRKYRRPDEQPNPAQLLQTLAPTYQKVSGSRAIGPHLDPDNTRSTSFKHLVLAIKKLLEDC